MTRLASRVTDPSVCTPHGTDGPATTGSPNVFINNLSALRVEDTGTYPSSCDSTFTQIKELIVGGGKVGRAVEGAQTVLVNQRELVAEGDGTLHSHGPGKMKRIGVDVYVGGPTLNVLEQSARPCQSCMSGQGAAPSVLTCQSECPCTTLRPRCRASEYRTTR